MDDLLCISTFSDSGKVCVEVVLFGAEWSELELANKDAFSSPFGTFQVPLFERLTEAVFFVSATSFKSTEEVISSRSES